MPAVARRRASAAPERKAASRRPAAAAVPSGITKLNPMGTDGFEFVEYTAPDTRALGRLFESMGFAGVARHRSKNVTLYRQGDINFIVNAEPDSFAQAFARVHGPSACAMAFRVADAAYAFKRAVELGAKPVQGKVGPDGAEHPGDRGHRRQRHLSRRPLWGRRQHLRHRLQAGCRRRPAATRASASPRSTT